MALRTNEQEPLLGRARSDSLSNPAIEDLIDAKLDPNASIDWSHETKTILTSSAQLSGTYLLQYFYNLITILVVSRLGRTELAATSIGITTMNIIGFSIFEGMATSLDTLCSQAYGSGNLKHVGLHTQRMLLFMLLVAIPIGAVWICSPWILPHLIPQPELAAPAGAFLRITLIGLPGYGLFEAGKRFLQAQGDFTASLVVLIVCAPINIMLNWLFVFRLDWGVPGAALAAALTNDIRALLLLLYIVFITPSRLQCWQPLSLAMFRNWGPMFWLSGAGAVMTLCEWAPFEILTFSTAYLGTAELAAQTLLATITIIVWHIAFSGSIAVSTRIGHVIGAGALHLAKQLARFYVPLFLALGLVEMSFLVALRTPIANLFTQDTEVRHLVKHNFIYIALFVVFDATTAGCHGVMRGLGRQSYGGWVTFILNAFYVLPLAIYLELGPPHLGLPGIWIATTTCLIMICCIAVVIATFMDWQKCVDEARGRETEHL